jgi:2-amino-4-hydroxy-6-hydroxymethyldihydropteridine diphosphokinase
MQHEIVNAYISIGSNLGDKLFNCRTAIAALERSATGRILARSRVYATEPVDFTDQDWFLNAAVKIETALGPHVLLERLIDIQQAAGRKRDTIRFGPRVLDLDIIFYGDLVIADGTLQIPHPRMHKRRFVLQPMCDIDPTVVHPVLGKNVKRLLDHLSEEGQSIRLYPCVL